MRIRCVPVRVHTLLSGVDMPVFMIARLANSIRILVAVVIYAIPLSEGGERSEGMRRTIRLQSMVRFR